MSFNSVDPMAAGILIGGMIVVGGVVGGVATMQFLDNTTGSTTSVERFRQKASVCNSLCVRTVGTPHQSKCFDRCLRKVTWAAIRDHQAQEPNCALPGL